MPERLILVDESNRAIGSEGKTAIHRAGLLHRAFSIFLIDDQARILLQRRSPQKYHSGGLWANSCCGHPRPGERTLVAARRRLGEELDVTPPLSFGFFSRYRADLNHGMKENELVYVCFGKLCEPPRPDPAEVSDVAWLALDELADRIERSPDAYAFWLKHYLTAHRAAIANLARRTARA